MRLKIKKHLLARSSDAEIVNELNDLQPDDAARLLRKLPVRRRNTIKAKIAEERRSEILQLADYSEDVAGGLMNSRYADLDASTPCQEAIRQLAAEDNAETIYEAFVVDDQRRLIGSVALRDLLRAQRYARVKDVMSPAVDSLTVDMPADAAARTLSASGHPALPVVDNAGCLVGIVTYDDAFRRLEQEASQDMERFAAVTGETDYEYLDVPVWGDFTRRAPWIFGLAVAGLMAGYVVHVYENALDALVILALYMPMVADTGGNVGTQTSGLLIRSIATGHVKAAAGLRVLWHEFRVGLLLAAMLFAFAFAKVFFISNSADVPAGLSLEMIALAIGVAIAVQAILSAVIGAVLPLLAIAIRQDPAVVAGPALTTIVDSSGLLLYFTITTAILGI